MAREDSIQIVSPPGCLPPNGHYSPAIVHGGLVYVSGQLGRSKEMPDEEAGDVAVQTLRVLTSVANILAAAGSDMTRLLKVNVYVSDIEHWPAVNSVYQRVLGPHRPARAIIPVRALHFNALIEIDAIAAT